MASDDYLGKIEISNDELMCLDEEIHMYNVQLEKKYLTEKKDLNVETIVWLKIIRY